MSTKGTYSWIHGGALEPSNSYVAQQKWKSRDVFRRLHGNQRPNAFHALTVTAVSAGAVSHWSEICKTAAHIQPTHRCFSFDLSNRGSLCVCECTQVTGRPTGGFTSRVGGTFWKIQLDHFEPTSAVRPRTYPRYRLILSLQALIHTSYL